MNNNRYQRGSSFGEIFGVKNDPPQEKRKNDYRPYDSKNQQSVIADLNNKISKANKLSEVLTVDQISLPDGYAYKVSNEIKLETNQLRKIFEQIKASENYLDDIERAKKELFKMLPIVAYSVGRNLCPKDFFELLSSCINRKALRDKDDIKALVDFMTSIVAYNKYLK